MLSVPPVWSRSGGAWLVSLMLNASVWAAPDRTLPAWHDLADDRAKLALRRLDAGTMDRSAQLAMATAWMSLQPATDDNLRRAEGIFARLATGRDDIAAQAAYLRARLYQIHYLQPDYAEAARWFTELAQQQPRNHWAQLGLVKLALLKLYVLPDAAGPDHRMGEAETLLTRIHEPGLRRDLHLQIGQAGVVLKLPPRRFLPHLVAADRIGGVTGTAREDLVVQIGELSLRAGLLGQAKTYFERYLREYPENLRAYAVGKRLEETERQLVRREGGGR